ncbi:MAG: hypothetical protein AAFV53_04685 [Myxococcota bacterium]
MGKRKALLFTDVARFADYIRLGYPEAGSKRGFTLYEVAWPDAPRQSALILLGHSARRWGLLDRLSNLFTNLDLGEVFQQIEVIESEEGLDWKQPTGRVPLAIRRKRTSHHLIELVELVPWKAEPPPGPILFVSNDVKAFGRLLIDSMTLGNDRILVAAAGEEQIARIEAPSWFLLDRCLEDDIGAFELFYPMPEAGGRVWLPWGWRHPLAALWSQSEADDPDRWLLFRPGQRRALMKPPAWQDVYDVADLDLDFSSTAAVMEPTSIEDRFSVPVRLSPRARPAEAELWLLEEAERDALESMLRSLDEADLSELLIAPIRPAGGGPMRYLIRERHAGKGRRFLSLDARGFAPWQGLAELLIPAEMGIEPRLRRDRYRSLFSLAGGTLTILVPRAGAPAQVDILQVAVSAFSPLSQFVDFILTAHAAQIEALQARNLFAFAPYTQAPARPDLLHRGPGGRSQRSAGGAYPASRSGTSSQAGRSGGPRRDDDPEKRARRRREGPQPILEGALNELQKEERTLERALIESPSAEQWWALQTIKRNLGKRDDAVICAIEAWWLSEARYEEDAARNLQDALADQLALKGSPSARCRQLLSMGRADKNQTFAYAFQSRGLPAGQLESWLERAEQMLREHEVRLPKKARWLAWGEIWRRNQDVRNQARVREQLLAALDSEGVSTGDVPTFILERLLADRALQPSVEEEEETSSVELQQALQNLDQLESGLEMLPSPLREGALASVGRSWFQLARADRGRRSLERSQQGSTPPPVISAWGMLMSAEALHRSAPSEAEQLRQQFQRQLGEMDAFIADQLREVEQEQVLRRVQEDPSAFLSAERVDRLFPQLGTPRHTDLAARLDEMQKARKKNRQAPFAEAAQAFLQGAVQLVNDGNPDLRELSRLLFLAVREIGTMEKLAGQKGLTRHFSQASQNIMRRVGGENDFFSILLQISLSRGLAMLKSYTTAQSPLKKALQNLREADFITLDLTDAASAALLAIELLPIERRAALVKQVLDAIRHQIPQLPDLASTPSTLNMLRLFDQLNEAASSKDQLTLARYRQYQDLDELLIRERILTEDHCL